MATGGNIWAEQELFRNVEPLPSGHVARIRAVKRAARHYSADAIHAHSSWAGVYARIRSAPVPVIYQPHCYAFEDSSKGVVRRSAFRAAEKMMSRRTAATIALSPHEKELAEGLSRYNRVFVVPNVPSIEGPGTEKSDTRPPREFIVSMSGRVTTQKDPEFFAAVARTVRSRHPRIRFRWIGAGDEHLEQILHASGVEVTGWKSGAELARTLSSSSVYFHTARYEGFPLAVLDAAALDIPIVVRNIAAFAGTPLRIVSTTAEAADAIVRTASSDLKADLVRRGRLLLDKMNSRLQAGALDEVYRYVSEK
ncbi:glycosyltransferase [Rhodococcus aetherivorans]|uniref:glycosyltransferase n=2 Tax=Rhodococcus TaxID=1827 RepID=UPI003B83625E